MTENSEQEAGEGQEQDGPKPRTVLGIPLRFAVVALIVPLFLIIGVTASLGISGVKNFISGPEKEAALVEQEPEHEEGDGDHGDSQVEDEPTYSILDFEEMILNVTGITASGRSTTRFMKVKLSLVYDGEQAPDIASRRPFMRDSFGDYMRQLTERDLEGTMGQISLKTELLKRAKAIVGNNAPKEILISDLVIQ